MCLLKQGKLSGLIATLASIINNRYQSRERDKDRQEQRREARIQAKEKILGADIDKALELLDSYMKTVFDLQATGRDIQLSDANKERINELGEKMNALGEELSKALDLPETEKIRTELKKVLGEYEFLVGQRQPEKLREYELTTNSLFVLLCSFEKEIIDAYHGLATAASTYLRFVYSSGPLDLDPSKDSELSKGQSKMFFEAGNLQRLLREKKILIRE